MRKGLFCLFTVMLLSVCVSHVANAGDDGLGSGDPECLGNDCGVPSEP